jgi:hypothetical protein
VSMRVYQHGGGGDGNATHKSAIQSGNIRLNVVYEGLCWENVGLIPIQRVIVVPLWYLRPIESVLERLVLLELGEGTALDRGLPLLEPLALTVSSEFAGSVHRLYYARGAEGWETGVAAV